MMLLYDNTETVVYECTDAEKVKKQIDLMTIPEEAISPLEFSMDCDVKITGRSAKERTIARFTDANGSSYKITSTGVFGLGLVLDSQPNDVIRIYRT